jgi:hypothetical protein
LAQPYHTLGPARRFREIIADPYVPLRTVAYVAIPGLSHKNAAVGRDSFFLLKQGPRNVCFKKPPPTSLT